MGGQMSEAELCRRNPESHPRDLCILAEARVTTIEFGIGEPCLLLVMNQFHRDRLRRK